MIHYIIGFYDEAGSSPPLYGIPTSPGWGEVQSPPA